jgi:hypothetical protein
MATILPFPIARRRSFILKQISHAALINPDAGIRYLQRQLDIQAKAMRRKGIAENLVQNELQCMRSALQAEFDGRVVQPER